MIIVSFLVIGFDSVSYSVHENDGSIVVTVEILSGSLSGSVEVRLTTVDGSARGVVKVIENLFFL